MKRRDSVCAKRHFNIGKETGVQLDKKHWLRTCAKISRNKSRRQSNHNVHKYEVMI